GAYDSFQRSAPGSFERGQAARVLEERSDTGDGTTGYREGTDLPGRSRSPWPATQGSPGQAQGTERRPGARSREPQDPATRYGAVQGVPGEVEHAGNPPRRTPGPATPSSGKTGQAAHGIRGLPKYPHGAVNIG